MRKTLLCLSVLSLLTIIFSCVPPDPAMVYGWNSNTPVSTITGPRILHKIDSANVTQKEYVSSSAGVLDLVKYYDTDDEIKLYYNSSNKVSKMVLTDPSMIMELSFSYNSADKITTGVMTSKLNNSNQTVMEETHYWMVYNTAGKLIKIDRKTKMFPFTGPFTHYGVINITWSGDNIVKVAQNNSGIIHPDGSMEPLDPMGAMVYKFEDYDNKINPYTTLPSEFNIGMGILAPLSFFQCSYNNHLKLEMEFFNMPIITYGNYIYDTQNYPVADPSGVMKFIYKPVQ